MTSLVERPPPTEGAADVSVVVPCLNAGRRLGDLVAAVRAQRGVGRVELLLADSGSTDGSIEAVASADLRLFDVDGPYDHGVVRTALVRAARAPLVALLSQDAVPHGTDYLARLAGAFDDPDVVGAYARQRPRPGADPLVRASLRRWTPGPDEAGDAPVVRRRPDGGLGALDPRAAMATARFDNVGSMVRRDALLELPFPSRPFGEDLAWGAAALEAGHALAYVPTACVEHSHRPTLREAFDRNRVAHRQAAGEFGLVAVPSLTGLVLAWAAGVPGDLRDGGPAWAVRGAPRRAAALLGQYLGAREARR